ncbi:MAG: PQQ-like beta-propeller repeat protein [Bryobacterales bacterium]|nr:PQQ-like beta-propeller repeat protein [Bryobacterales bacterium]
MTFPRDGERNGNRQPRLWPGVAAVVLQWLLQLGMPVVWADGFIYGLMGGFLCAAVVLVWWVFFSRTPLAERVGAVVLIAGAMAITPRIVDRSIATGMMGRMWIIYAVPVMCLALVAWAAVTRGLPAGRRGVALVGAILAGCGLLALLRTDGITGEGRSLFAWRWAKTSEERFLARVAPVAAQAEERAAESVGAPAVREADTTAPVNPVRETPSTVEWPGFRGPHRDDIVTGVRIRTDWAAAPPVRLWRREVGPGWSSFAVGDGRVYTQEQRGESEVVACYDAKTGEPVWAHLDEARFWESNGGAGPRGTPALHDGRVYTLGATGIVNALDASDGRVVWTRNAAADTGAKVPGWGFSGSPLVVDDAVLVAAGGQLIAYDLATGSPRWKFTAGGGGYSSPQLVTLDGVRQVLLMSGSGTTSVGPGDGKVLWTYAWEGAAILQPAMTEDGDVLLNTSDMSGGLGTRRLAVAHGSEGWTAKEVWTSRGLKPYFNDIVVHKGHAYGFDGGILACIDLQDGRRKWKGGRFGHGQLLLLRDQDLLLVVSEEGELGLVAADPGQFAEIARAPGIEGKTWNHPVFAGGILHVRNGEEMAAFRLARAGS